jgi:hypothetical protein
LDYHIWFNLCTHISTGLIHTHIFVIHLKLLCYIFHHPIFCLMLSLIILSFFLPHQSTTTSLSLQLSLIYSYAIEVFLELSFKFELYYSTTDCTKDTCALHESYGKPFISMSFWMIDWRYLNRVLWYNMYSNFHLYVGISVPVVKLTVTFHVLHFIYTQMNGHVLWKIVSAFVIFHFFWLSK